MHTVAQASASILADIARLAEEKVALLDAVGRVLARDAVAPLAMPPWRNSAMDGYAVLAADIGSATADAPVRLRVLETVAAGGFPTRPVARGEATRIMTGAPLPDAADTVVRVEDTDGGTERVEIRNSRDARKNIRARGEDYNQGDTVLTAGDALGAAQIGVLASMGLDTVAVYRSPRVALISSGDELVDLDRFDEVLAGQKIVTSNSYTLTALVRAAGGDAINLGIAPDQPEALRERVETALDGKADLIVTSAGASVGEYDYVRQVLASLGAELKFWRVRMRPGAPLGFGTVRGVPWIGLPGNPVSAMVTFELFVRPALRKMLGFKRLFRRPVQAILEEPVAIQAKLTHFLRAVLRVREDGQMGVRLTGPQGSAILTSMAKANALLVVPEDCQSAIPGDLMTALPLSDDAQLGEEFFLQL
ncbi:MAG TPA: gephyrin-like molybdotransferase Glp [Gemmatimonadaceae bacterium]|nr:gephyrin-like molybdotransferase Glp [Gemmatimonadaceae bacterium]